MIKIDGGENPMHPLAYKHLKKVLEEKKLVGPDETEKFCSATMQYAVCRCARKVCHLKVEHNMRGDTDAKMQTSFAPKVTFAPKV